MAAEHLHLPGEGGANGHLKVPALVAGMVAGADSIDDMDLLRHGGMGRLFTGVRAPSTLGIFLRTFTFGHVRQARRGRGPVPGRAEPYRPDPARGGPGRLPRHRRHGQGHPRVPKAGRRVRVHQGQGPERVDRHGVHPARRAGDRRDPAAQGQHELGPRRGPDRGPTRWPPARRGGGHQRMGKWSSCAPTAPTTTTTWSPPHDAAGPGSPSPPG